MIVVMMLTLFAGQFLIGGEPQAPKKRGPVILLPEHVLLTSIMNFSKYPAEISVPYGRNDRLGRRYTHKFLCKPGQEVVLQSRETELPPRLSILCRIEGEQLESPIFTRGAVPQKINICGSLTKGFYLGWIMTMRGKSDRVQAKL